MLALVLVPLRTLWLITSCLLGFALNVFWIVLLLTIYWPSWQWRPSYLNDFYSFSDPVFDWQFLQYISFGVFGSLILCSCWMLIRWYDVIIWLMTFVVAVISLLTHMPMNIQLKLLGWQLVYVLTWRQQLFLDVSKMDLLWYENVYSIHLFLVRRISRKKLLKICSLLSPYFFLIKSGQASWSSCWC